MIPKASEAESKDQVFELFIVAVFIACLLFGIIIAVLSAVEGDWFTAVALGGSFIIAPFAAVWFIWRLFNGDTLKRLREFERYQKARKIDEEKKKDGRS